MWTFKQEKPGQVLVGTWMAHNGNFMPCYQVVTIQEAEPLVNYLNGGSGSPMPKPTFKIARVSEIEVKQSEPELPDDAC